MLAHSQKKGEVCHQEDCTSSGHRSLDGASHNVSASPLTKLTMLMLIRPSSQLAEVQPSLIKDMIC